MINVENLLTWLMNNLEITVAILGGVSISGLMYLKRNHNTENDLTSFCIKYKRCNENINKAVKSVL